MTEQQYLLLGAATQSKFFGKGGQYNTEANTPYINACHFFYIEVITNIPTETDKDKKVTEKQSLGLYMGYKVIRQKTDPPC